MYAVSYTHLDVYKRQGMWLSLRVTVPLLARRFVSEMKDRMYTAKLGEKRRKRSLDANAYCWVLLGKLSVELSKNCLLYTSISLEADSSSTIHKKDSVFYL